MLDVSIVIACYNGASTLRETLDSLTAQVWDGAWEIVLADNGSTDPSAAIFADCARAHPQIPMRRVDASARRGKSFALNTGIHAARGRALLFCDADDTVGPGWLAAMAAALRHHPFVAARLDVVRLNPNWAYRSVERELVLRRLTHAPYCLITGGGQMGFHRSLFDAVGPFDPAFVAQEDHDFCIRAFFAGFRPHPVPGAVLNYRFRTDPAAIYRQSYSYAWNRALLRKRYAPQPIVAPAAWTHLGHRLLRHVVGQGLKALRGRRSTEFERARFNDRLGRMLGDAAGALANGVAPPRRSAPPPPAHDPGARPLSARPPADRTEPLSSEFANQSTMRRHAR